MTAAYLCGFVVKKTKISDYDLSNFHTTRFLRVAVLAQLASIFFSAVGLVMPGAFWSVPVPLNAPQRFGKRFCVRFLLLVPGGLVAQDQPDQPGGTSPLAGMGLDGCLLRLSRSAVCAFWLSCRQVPLAGTAAWTTVGGGATDGNPHLVSCCFPRLRSA